MVTFTVELTDAEALAYAQFLKRSGFSDYKAASESEEQAYQMRDAASKVREALAAAGFAPR